MHNQSAEKKKLVKFIAVILAMIVMLTGAMPTGAVSEMQEAEDQNETEQILDDEGLEYLQKSEQISEENETELEKSDSESGEIENDQETDANGDIIENFTSNTERETENESLFSEDMDDGSTEQTEYNDANQIMTASLDSDLVEAPDWIGNIDNANEWQIVAEEYSGREQSDKQSYDIDQDGSDDIFYQKNVIPTGVENEFRVYLGITKKMSWDELLAESDFGVTTSRKYKTEGELETNIVGNFSIISPGKSTSGGNNYEAVVTFTRNGQVVHTYRGWYHGTTPNCSNGTGFIVLKSLGLNLIASCSVNLQNSSSGSGGQLSYTIDLDTMSNKKIHFSVEDIVTDSVEDTMGDYITYENVENCDGSYTYNENSKTLTWEPASNGASGIQVKENGGLTGYHYNIHQLVYTVHLNAEQDGFNSCAQNMNSNIGDAESYPVNQQAILNCHMGSYTGSTEFQIPYVRGLLYDLEFQKVIKDSEISISGIQFTVTRNQNGNTLAEQLAKTDQESTDDDGWIKFHNLPWGTYTLKELVGTEGSFQSDYLTDTEQNSDYEIKIGKVINSSALSTDHDSGHSVDLAGDVNNMLFKYNGNSTFENTPNTAKITIKKIVNEYDIISEELQNQSYSIQINSVGEKDIYLQPESTDISLVKLENKEKPLKHGETETYDLIVPKEGGVLKLEEIIPTEIDDKIVFESAELTENEGSTDAENFTVTEQGCEVNILPGNDLTITIINIPVGKIKIQEVIDNYREELANDAFIISVKSVNDTGTEVNTEPVLKHDEMSGTIIIKKITTLSIDEILPKEYQLSQISLSGGGNLEGNQVTVKPGEDVIIIVHNTYSGKSFFHAADAIKNIFRRK